MKDTVTTVVIKTSKLLIYLNSIILLMLIYSPFASAHVVVKDDSNSYGIIMHAVPDDDPIAGDITQFYFDIENESLNTNNYNYSLSITDLNSQSNKAAVYVIDQLSLVAEYTFTTQGTYQLTLRADPIYISGVGGDAKTFIYQQDVYRGIGPVGLTKPKSYQYIFIAIITLVFILSIFRIVNNVKYK